MAKNSRDAENYVASFNARQRSHRPGILKHVPKRYVFSLYWHSFTVHLGHMGAFVIPALDRSDPEQVKRGYSEPLAVPETIAEEYDMIDGKLGVEFWNAEAEDDDPEHRPGWVSDLLGIASSGSGLSTWTTDRTWFGVFVARGLKATPAEQKKYRERGEVWDFPTQYEIDLARKKLDQMAMVFYKAAEELALQGDKGRAAIDAPHREFAEYLGNFPDWARAPQKKATCPECGGAMTAGMFVHFVAQGGCGAVLDEEKVRKNRTPGYEHIWAPKAPPVPATR